MRVKTYYSVAWVRTNDYWNDAPGRQSMRFNYELISRGFRIERVHILPDELWPFDEKLPSGGILEWLVEQQGRGIVVSLVRESDLTNEPDFFYIIIVITQNLSDVVPICQSLPMEPNHGQSGCYCCPSNP